MKNTSVLDSIENSNCKFEVIEFSKLEGGQSSHAAEKLFFQEKSGIKLKQVKINLKNGSVKLESGALSFMKGNLNVQNQVTKGFFKNLGSNLLSGESLFKPEYNGVGEIWLEPTFGHYMLIELDNDEIIVDKGLFYACESSLEVSAVVQKNVSSALFGGEGFFQTKVKGSGIVVLSVPVPMSEVIVYNLNNETLQVDGNFALLRRGDISFSVEMITKGIVGTMASGEGLLQTFKGTGEVWLAPTQGVYEKLNAGYSLNSISGKSSNTHTK